MLASRHAGPFLATHAALVAARRCDIEQAGRSSAAGGQDCPAAPGGFADVLGRAATLATRGAHFALSVRQRGAHTAVRLAVVRWLAGR